MNNSIWVSDNVPITSMATDKMKNKKNTLATRCNLPSVRARALGNANWYITNAPIKTTPIPTNVKTNGDISPVLFNKVYHKVSNTLTSYQTLRHKLTANRFKPLA